MPVIISTLISTLVPVLKDGLSKNAAGATILFAVYQGIKRIAETLDNDFGLPQVYAEWSIWGLIVLVLLFAPAEWLKARIALINTLIRRK